MGFRFPVIRFDRSKVVRTVILGATLAVIVLLFYVLDLFRLFRKGIG